MKGIKIGSIKFTKYLLVGLFLISFGIILSGCHIGDNRMRGNGNMVDREISVDSPITGIDVSMVSATIKITAAQSDKISYMIDENLENYLDIRVKNGILTIDSTNDRILGRNNRITFRVSTQTLEELNILGDFIVDGNGTFHTDRFRTDVMGAAKVDMELDAETVDIEIDGAANLTLAGKTENLTITGNGASAINTKDLIANDVSVQFNGAGTIDVYAENSLDISGAGAGAVRYWGNPSVSKNTVGMTSVKKGDS